MQVESFLEHFAAATPHATAIVCEDRRLTYSALEARANRLAHALIDAGVERGDRVAIWLDDPLETVVSLFATLKAGAVVVILDSTKKADSVAYVLNDAAARVLILPGERVGSLAPRWAELSDLETLIVLGAPDGAAGSKRVCIWAELLERSAARSAPPPKRAINLDLAALIYTSGSTGKPKGVMLTHLNMYTVSASIMTYLGNTCEDVILNVLPLSFGYGLYQVINSVRVGSTVILERSFAFPAAVLQKIAAERVTGFPSVPTIVAVLLQMDLSKFDLSSLRYMTNAAAALPVDHILRLRKLLPHVRFFSMYGQTECQRVCYMPPEQLDARPASVGIAIPFTEVYVVDEQGQRVPPGVVGELVVRGAHVMKGYWRAPEETARKLRPGPLPDEKVLYTGDLFRTDDEGYLYFVSRRDDIIKSRGQKVAPREVENVLHTHPDIAEAAVVGVDDPILGQAVKAFVVLRPGAQLATQELLAHCARRLEDFMVPKQVEFRPALPRNASGKVDKLSLK